MHKGLSETEARRRLTQHGPNDLPVPRPRGVLRLLRAVASTPMFLLPALLNDDFASIVTAASLVMPLSTPRHPSTNQAVSADAAPTFALKRNQLPHA